MLVYVLVLRPSEAYFCLWAFALADPHAPGMLFPQVTAQLTFSVPSGLYSKDIFQMRPSLVNLYETSPKELAPITLLALFPPLSIYQFLKHT